MPEQSLETQHILRKFDYLVGQKNLLEKLHVEHWKGHDQAILSLSSASSAAATPSPYAKRLDWANNASGGLFVFGLILLLVFTTANLKVEDAKMTDQRQQPPPLSLVTPPQSPSMPYPQSAGVARPIAPARFPTMRAAGAIPPAPYPDFTDSSGVETQAEAGQSMPAATPGPAPSSSTATGKPTKQ